MTNTVAGLRVVCIYSSRSGFDICSSDAGLRHFADQVRMTAATMKSTFVQCDEHADPAPYDEVIQQIEIKATEAVPLLISHETAQMQLAGGADSLRLLALNVDNLIAGVAPHMHFEYYPGHFYLASQSEPLVVSKAE